MRSLALILLMVALAAPVHAQPESRSVVDASDPVGGDARGSVARVTLPGPASVSGLPDALDGIASASVRTSGALGAPAFLSLRASEPRNGRVWLQGIPLDGAYGGPFDLGTLPPELFDAAVIYRSIVPLTLGPAPPGGVMELRVAPDGDDGGHAAVSGGSFASRKLAVGHRSHSGRGMLRSGIVVRGAENRYLYFDDGRTPRDPTDDRDDQRRANAGFDDATGLLLWSTQEFDVLALGAYRVAGVPGTGSLQTQRTRESSGRLELGLRWHRPVPRSPGISPDVRTTVSFATRRFADPRGELSARPNARSLDRAWRARLLAAPVARFRDRALARPLFEVGFETWRGEDVRVDVPRAHRTTLSLGLEAGASPGWRWFDPVASVRSDVALDAVSNRDSTSDADVGWEAQAGWTAHAVSRAGLTWDLTATAARTSRRPRFAERYGDSSSLVGNPELRPEWRVGGDLTSRLAVSRGVARLDWVAGGFSRAVHDLIVFVDAANGARTPRNVARASLSGLEQELRVDAWGSAWAAASYSWTRATDRDTGLTLPYRPAHAGSFELGAHAVGVEVSSRIDAQSERTTTRDAGSATPRRVEWGARFAWTPQPAPRWTFAVDARNLLDVRSEQVQIRDGGERVTITRAVEDYAGLPLPGRSVFGTVAYCWLAPSP